MRLVSSNGIAVVTMLVVVGAGAGAASAHDCLEVKGSPKKESRTLEAFTAIDIDSAADVVIQLGDTHRVDIEAPSDLLPLLRTRVSEGALVIDTKSCVNMRGKQKVLVKVTMRSLRGLRVDGSGNVSARSEVRGDRLDLGIGGSGNVTLGVSVKELAIEVSGSGNIELEGKAGTIGVEVTGSGDIDLKAVTARRARVRLVGSGDIAVHALDALDAQVTGSGDIRYVGAPKKLQKSVTGSGSIVPAG